MIWHSTVWVLSVTDSDLVTARRPDNSQEQVAKRKKGDCERPALSILPGCVIHDFARPRFGSSSVFVLGAPPKDTCQQKFEICESFFNCFPWGWGLFGSHKRVQSVLVIWYCIKLIKIVVWAVGSRSVMAFGMQVAVRMHWFEWDFRASTLTTLTAPGSWSTKPAHLYKVRSLAEPCGALLFLLFWFWTDLWGRDTHHEVSHGLITDGVFMNIVWQCLTCLHPFPSTKDLQEFYGRCMIV